MTTIIQTLMAMDYVQEANRNRVNFNPKIYTCWWNVPAINKTLWDADKLGFVSRISNTQVQWTQKGIDTLIGYR